jgi:hypothetical protein
MKHRRWHLLSIATMISGVGTVIPVPSAASLAKMSATITSSPTLYGFMTLTPSPDFAKTTATPRPTNVPDPEALGWPLTLPSREQIDAARHCDVESLLKSRSDATLDNPLSESNSPTACDWAVVAAAYAKRADDKSEKASTNGKLAYLRAIMVNPAFAAYDDLLGAYRGLVNAPPFASQPITKVEMRFEWSGGLAVPVQQIDYKITITKADTKRPVVSGTLKTLREKGTHDQDSTPIANDGAIRGTVDPALIQALGPSLVDLVPVNYFVNYLACTDNYPDWHVKLTFKDGTQLELFTNKSNAYFAGGPWQTTIDGQKYIQFGPEFLNSLSDLTSALKMPHGATGAMSCGGGSIFERVYQ